jgi:NAD(P)-dependent dehydrogenase (short-subunit alcohol dehydrogenase family)
MNRLLDQVALITGGNKGIGLATARLFAQEGAKVAITARDQEAGEAAVREIVSAGGEAFYVPLDVRQRDSCETAVAMTVSEYGRIDILFNNAGVVPRGSITETTDDTWLDVFASNVHGVFYISRAVIPHMIAAGGGVIINNASDWAIVGGQNATAYAATKGAVAQMTRSMALDYARQGIRVNAICPGDTVVDRWRTWQLPAGVDFDTHIAALGKSFPLGRVAQADEIARAVLFLASDDSSYMTGQMLIVDGGNTAGGASTKYTNV